MEICKAGLLPTAGHGVSISADALALPGPEFVGQVVPAGGCTHLVNTAGQGVSTPGQVVCTTGHFVAAVGQAVTTATVGHRVATGLAEHEVSNGGQVVCTG